MKSFSLFNSYCILPLSSHSKKILMLNQNYLQVMGVAYPVPSGKHTAPPAGYVPVYISHYGRYESRYLLSEQDYIRPLQVLERADSAGVLSEKGRETMAKICRMYADFLKV